MRRVRTARRALAAAAAAALAGTASWAPPARGDERTDAMRVEFEKKKKAILIEAGTRQVKVGLWCRDAGLVPQATAELLRAVELSEGENPWALKVLALMRNLDDRFWKAYRNEKPSKGMLAAHEKRAKESAGTLRKERLALAKWAEKQRLEDEAYGEYLGVVRAAGGALEFDAQGRVVVEGSVLPESISRRLREDAVTINGRLHVRDEFLELVPEVKEIHQAETEALRVRSEKGADEAKDHHALCEAAFPALEAEVGGRPTERMTVYVFETRPVYESYLKKTKMASHTPATGIADGGRRLVLVCAQGLDADTVRGVILHELAHLFQYGVTPVVMPSWYSEGFAESFGGEGAWTWDGKRLVLGRDPPESCLAPLRSDEGFVPLSKLLAADALDLISSDRSLAHRFYGQSWAFYRWLQTGAPKDVADAFRLWEGQCRGTAIGAEVGKPEARDPRPASELFRTRLGARLADLEKGFRDWLSKR